MNLENPTLLLTKKNYIIYIYIYIYMIDNKIKRACRQ